MDKREKVIENKLRRVAKRQGFMITKSRSKFVYPMNIDNYGGYMIIDNLNNKIAAGEKFNLTLEEIEQFLSEGRRAD